MRNVWTDFRVAPQLGFALLAFAIFVLCSAQSAGANPDTQHVRGFADVNVIDVQGGVVLEHMDVEVSEGVITRVRPARRPNRAPARGWVDGRGLYLAPGLIDMHVHLDDRLHAQVAAPTLSVTDEELLSIDDLSLFLAHGITSIQVMHGAPEMLRLRDQIDAGAEVGPQLIVGSPRIDGLPASDPYVRIAATPEVGRALVDEMRSTGYDFIKLYDGLDAPTYSAVIARAHELGLRVDGHLARTLPLSTSLFGGQGHVAHIEEFASFAPNLDERDIEQLTDEVQRSGIGVTSTLVVYQHMLRFVADPVAPLSDPEIAYAAPLIFARWLPGRNGYGAERFRSPDLQARLHRRFDFMRALTLSFVRAGVPVAAGSDCNDSGAGVVPGFSFHEELRILSDIGLTPAEVLRSATLNGAEAMGLGDVLGSVTQGKRADLLLLRGNPLADIRNTELVAGVMVRGRWLHSGELNAGVGRMLSRYQALEDRLGAPMRRPAPALDQLLQDHR